MLNGGSGAVHAVGGAAGARPADRTTALTKETFVGVYAVTGSASGMGQQAAQKLRDAGHTVIGVDLRDAEVVADLSTPDGRQAAADGVRVAAGNQLDGVVLAAGIGPTPGADRPRLIYQINYFGVTDLLEAWRPLLAAAGNAKVVVVASNSTTTTPLVPRTAVRALLNGDTVGAVRAVKWMGRLAPTMAYAASKIAVSRWVRRQAVTPEWAGAGIRLNALAPGAILTPLLQKQLDTPSEAKAIRAFPVPIGEFGNPSQLGDWMVFMLSDSANFLCGSVVFVDGGSDAYLRGDDWPTRVETTRLPWFMTRFLGYRRRNKSAG
jgi:NAD(P)-dependent dehydrogenase (short-subunit alcohol dehydrogenase family)